MNTTICIHLQSYKLNAKLQICQPTNVNRHFMSLRHDKVSVLRVLAGQKHDTVTFYCIKMALFLLICQLKILSLHHN